MITVKEIALRCNVSPSTVSNILNGKTNMSEQTRQKVLAAVKETGYQPNFFAQSMRKQRSRIIGIITEDLNEFSAGPIVEAVMNVCDDHGYRTILMNLRLYDKWQDTWFDDEEKLSTVLKPMLQEALSIRVDGLVYVAGHCRVISCLPEEFPLPVVFAYGVSRDERYPSVIIDDEKGGFDVTRYLIDRGHTRIGVIGGRPDNLHTKSRLLGYRKALSEGGIVYDPHLVRYGNWYRQSGYQEVKHLIDEGVSAVFCMNDNMAAGVYDYLYEKGMEVGQDLSVAGYDDKEIADYLRPGLTTSRIQLGEIGKESGEIMIRLLEKEEKSAGFGIRKIPCKIIERASVESRKEYWKET